MNLEQTLEYIHRNYWNGGTFGLGRMVRLLDLIGHPEKDLKFIHIGGTNGKGSTASMSANILRKAGYTVGLYTSPYIFRFHERMQVNGECITDEELIEICGRIKEKADPLENQPSEFELVTCIAFEFFKRHKCDIIALEVGLGGEFDATNTIGSPEVAVMTNIGLDHVELLGDTLEKIAEVENIQISDEKVQEEIAKMAEMYKMEVEKLNEVLGDAEKEQMKADMAVQEAVTLVADAAVEA